SQLSGQKYRWGDMTLDAYENAIEICLALAKATNDAQYNEKAFYYAEKSRSLSLLESFQDAKAKKTSGLPIEEIEKAEELELDISDLEQEIFQLNQQKTKDQAKIDELSKERYAKIQERDAFMERLEKDYPKYYEAKYGTSFMQVADVQGLLEGNQAFLEYFVGDSGVYVFKVTPEDLEIIELGRMPNLIADVVEFRKSIYGYYLYSSDRSEQTYAKYAKEYAENAYAMYQKLVEPIGALPKKLIIIPAGPIGNMPFEPLLMKAAEDPNQFKRHAYMIKEYMISYCYSATLLREMKNRQHREVEGKYLAFAPKFGESSESVIRGERFALAPLAFNTTEVEKISEFLGFGTVLKGNEATEAAFKEKGSEYKVIHFATHGMANDRNPDYSLLAFTEIPDSIENEFLYVRDLYNMELNADMVVLSACETGLGELRKAEGVISLARGFSYAGAKSIFTTLWSVNDQATYRIVEAFYKHLKEGKPKDEALHLAKVDFIESSNNLTAHPFLWSPFILVGDMSPVEALADGFPMLYLAIGGGVLLLGLVVFGAMRMKRKKEW
ncbi:MAG: CHAT domain-containing protein, partial [Aureispira sp.]|nr:CHAT domain-containing protein [Aureispira sp.]